MDLITNTTFRIISELETSTSYEPGIYRVILNEPRFNKMAVVLIHPEREGNKDHRGGRRKKQDAMLKRPRKKGPQPLVGKLIWMDSGDVQGLIEKRLLLPITVERRPLPTLGAKAIEEFELRRKAMAGFLDIKNLHESLAIHNGLGGLVRQAKEAAHVSSYFVYKQWSNLCRFGLTELSLMPCRDRSGAPGVSRRCDTNDDGELVRKKPGRKPLKVRIGRLHGVIVLDEQPGMSSGWIASINAADRQIPTPKPSWPKRYDQILRTSFCGKAKENDGAITYVAPQKGTYPTAAQVKRVLTVGKTQLERLLETTTKRHFNSNLRGLSARNWKGVAGPGHTAAIDSTVGDIYLRSSVNRAWIVGRPIVYVIVDIWSTAVVGFYVCLTGPSWSTARVSLFNAYAGESMIADLWGYQPMHTLHPEPTLCYNLLCDRGEYLSKGQRITALKLLFQSSYTPPYRGDLKGLVEVLHRIAKDEQFFHIPGAMNYRRAELELRRVNPADCVYTVREYTQFLYEIFSRYNLEADRTHRVDAHMRAAGVFPSPAGLWRWGHEMGMGFRRHIDQDDLISALLPQGTGRVTRSAVRYAGCDYQSAEIEALQYTALARNMGGWDIPVHNYPGNRAPIWTPNATNNGLMRLGITSESIATPNCTYDEWSDSWAQGVIDRPGEAHERMLIRQSSVTRIQALTDKAKRLTQEALEKSSGKAPTMTEARHIEHANAEHPSGSESKAADDLRTEAMEQYEDLMSEIYNSNGQDR